jgi:hypothetical protein
MKDDDVSGLSEMVDADDFRAANKRTLDILDNFSSLIKVAVEGYPQGDLYEFLSLVTTAFAISATRGNMIRFTDVGRFFEDCGFDRRTVLWMVYDYHASLCQEGSPSPQSVKALEEYYKCSKRKS